MFVLSLVVIFFLTKGSCLCSDQKNCDKCISYNYACGWCKDLEYNGNRCDDLASLSQLCKTTENPRSSAEPKNGTEAMYINIQPKNVKLLLRKDEFVTFNVTTVFRKEPPLQIQFSIDFSESMSNEWNTMKGVTTEIVKEFLQEPESMAGYTAFVDKTTFPIISYMDYDESKPKNPFYFKIISPLSRNENDIIRKMEAQSISTNIDVREASFEGIVQTAACDSIGWSQDPNILKLIVVITDAGSKTAGDGRIVSVIAPHDGKCHTGSDSFYRHGLFMDYPSPGVVEKVLFDKKISLIFAVTNESLPEYENLVKTFSRINAMATKLEEGANNIIEIIRNARKELNSRFYLLYERKNGLVFNIETTCPKNKTLDGNTQVCTGVTTGETVTFTVSVKYNGEGTPGEGKFKLSVSTFGDVDVEYNTIDGCNCTNLSNKVEGSNVCSGNGYALCGECNCKEGWYGEKCSCKLQDYESMNLCKQQGSNLVCSGHGTCDCGKCTCVNDNQGNSYTGNFCQYGIEFCPKHNGLVCGGPDHGICNENKCECNKLYLGEDCSIKNCQDPDWDKACLHKEETCGNRGTCNCGICNCNLGYSGAFCEQRTVPINCFDFNDGVSCFMFGYTFDSNDSCEMPLNLYSYEEDPNGKFTCSFVMDNGCYVYFRYEETQNSNYTVKVKRFEESKDCPKPVNVAAIAGGVFGALILIGIILIILYIIANYLFERAMYKKFVDERTNTPFQQTQNPLYENQVAASH